MKTVSFGNAFPLKYQRNTNPEGNSHNLSEPQAAEREALVGDRFTHLVTRVTGHEAERVSTQQGDFLVLDGPNARTLSFYRAIKKAFGKADDLQEEQSNNQVILETLTEQDQFRVHPKALVLLYGKGPNESIPTETETRVQRFFEKLGISKQSKPISTEPVLPETTSPLPTPRNFGGWKTIPVSPTDKQLNPLATEFTL
jgi:hypothetical protein